MNQRFIGRFSFVLCVVVAIFCGLSFLSGSKASAQLTFENNSTQKIRAQPGPQAARIGSAVNWVADFETAMRKSQETGKPVFWYVPTLRGSFMDRKDSMSVIHHA